MVYRLEKKMKGRIVVLLATAVVAGAVGPQAALQTASPSGDARGRVDLNLSDGSRICGSVEGVSITLVLPYGTLVLPLSEVAGLERQEGGVLVSLRNGDRMRGRVEAPKALDVRTPYGTLSVPVPALTVTAASRTSPAWTWSVSMVAAVRA